MIERMQARLAAWPDPVLTLALLAGAAVIAVIALQPGKPLEKALVLAYIVLP